jgi:pimeloyl-ACP methyl ester carboxylesterase
VAAAAQLPDRVTGAVVVAGVTDMAWPGAWDGYVDLEAELMRAPDLAAAVALATERLGADGGGFLEDSGFDMPAPDLALLDEPEAGAAEFTDLIEAFRQGVDGYARDVFIQGLPWAFDPGAVTAPVHVVHGELDTLLPVAHSRHTADLVPGATLTVLPGHGHLSIIREFPALFAEIHRAAGPA